MRPSGIKEPGRGCECHHRRLPAAATVLYPPDAGSAVRTAQGFELKGAVCPYGNDTTWHFEYGATTPTV